MWGEVIFNASSTIQLHWIASGDFNNALNPNIRREDFLFHFFILQVLIIIFYNVALLNALYRVVNIHGENEAWLQTLIKF